MNKNIPDIIDHIERELAHYYGFQPQSAAKLHVVDRDQIHRSLGDAVKEQSEWNASAGVWFVQDQSDEMFIGIHFDEEITTPVSEADPRAELSADNLNAFCTIVEEISHFHLLLNRASDKKPVSKVELECQGEVDKLLVSALLLERQSGSDHMQQLTRVLYDQAITVAKNSARYWEATKFAARMWQAPDSSEGIRGIATRAFLQDFYRAPWHEKRYRLSA